MASPSTPSPPEWQDAIDRDAIVDVLSRYALGVDRRDAAVYRACFCDAIDVDMGGHARTGVSADAWVEEAFGLVARFESTQHLIANHDIRLEGDRAFAWADLQAQHWRPDGYWLVIGRYQDEMRRGDDGWRIEKLGLEIVHSTRTGSLLSRRGDGERS